MQKHMKPSRAVQLTANSLLISHSPFIGQLSSIILVLQDLCASVHTSAVRPLTWTMRGSASRAIRPTTSCATGTSRQPTTWQWPSCFTTSSTTCLAKSASASSLGRKIMPTLHHRTAVSYLGSSRNLKKFSVVSSLGRMCVAVLCRNASVRRL